MQNGFSRFKICCGVAKSAAWCQNQHRLLSALLDANNQVGQFIASSSLSASSSSATSSSSSSLTSISPVLLFFHTINIIFCPALSSFFCWCSPATGDIFGDKYFLWWQKYLSPPKIFVVAKNICEGKNICDDKDTCGDRDICGEKIFVVTKNICGEKDICVGNNICGDRNICSDK